mmetsp:Transcript_1758/g.3986  ORF Transcript_1758/g.3986 Transcript_1758/m.3986 type:complete len:228 (-) Transcript_1758:41-724(-)
MGKIREPRRFLRHNPPTKVEQQVAPVDIPPIPGYGDRFPASEPEKQRTKKEKALEKRRNFLSKLEAAQGALQHKSKEKKADKPSTFLGGMSDFTEFLAEVSQEPSANKKKSVAKKNPLADTKTRKQETDQFKKVLEHPAFLASPFDTIKEHLKNTSQLHAQQQQDEQERKHRAEVARKRTEKKLARARVQAEKLHKETQEKQKQAQIRARERVKKGTVNDRMMEMLN